MASMPIKNKVDMACQNISSQPAIDEKNTDQTTLEHSQNTLKSNGRTDNKINNENLVYCRKTGAMSVAGHLYETKLLTLVLLRFLNTKPTLEFYLGANLAEAGDLDDVCFKYKPANSDKHIIVFMQAKHKVNPDKRKIWMSDVLSDGVFSVANHFESYLMIRQKFTPKSKNVIFKGDYHDSHCFFLVYTPLKHNIKLRKSIAMDNITNSVEGIIRTNLSGDIFQLEYEVVKSLTKNLVERNLRKLGKLFLEYALTGKVSNSLDEQLFKTYAVVLLQFLVFEDSEPNVCRFQNEFFNNKERLCTIFRESLCAAAVNCKALHPKIEDLKALVTDSLKEVTAESISNIIGNIVYYDNAASQLVLIEDSNDSDFDRFKHLKVEATIIQNAINIKGKKLLAERKLFFPVAFRNIDLNLKDDGRLDFLATALLKLMDTSNFENGVNIVLVNEEMVGHGRLVQSGVVKHDGGLGSALGNLLVVDRYTDTLKFNADAILPEHANRLWNILKQKHNEQLLTTYRFKFCVHSFPKYSFQDDLYEEYLAKDFIGHYWLCTGQAKEDAVEDVAKKEIDKLLASRIRKNTLLRIKSDAIFLMLHHKAQKWWMVPEKEKYLTEQTSYLRETMEFIVNDRLLSVLNHISVSKLRSNELEFDEAAVLSLGLDDYRGLVLIVTNFVSFTAMKLLQTKSKYTFIDFNYGTSLLYYDIAIEIMNSEVDNLVITCAATNDVANICQTLVQFIEELPDKNVTVIANAFTSDALKRELTCACREVRDERNALVDFCTNSQEKLLSGCHVVFQGEDAVLKSVANGCEHLITSHLLQKIVNREVIEIGKPLATPSYKQIKQFYIERYLTCCKKLAEKSCEVKTLNDIAQNIVVITAPPGMGKSTFLTHLSLETKKKYPNVWIARINLLDHTEQYQKWQQNNTVVKLATLSFLCNAAVVIKSDGDCPTDSLQRELFINLCNAGRVIFIFDGFDEVCPLYETEVIQLMKVTATSAWTDQRDSGSKKPKLWIASRSYNNVKDVLERAFGPSYTLVPLSAIDQRLYLEKYWKEHMKLAEFSYCQFKNVCAFMEFMKKFCDKDEFQRALNLLKPIHAPLHGVFIAAACYFRDQINNINMPLSLDYRTDTWRTYLRSATFHQLNHVTTLQSSPLHTHIAAEYLQNDIKCNMVHDIENTRWNLDISTFSLYKRFLEMKLTKIRLGDKIGFDTSKPDSKVILNREQAEFIDMHRILACYALFRDDVHHIMSVEELRRVHSKIREIKLASEKTGVIDCIVGDVPRFVHLTFAEYFAAEYICEALKTAYTSQQMDTVETIWNFILTKVIMHDVVEVRGFLDFILFHDEVLKIRILGKQTEIIVFECLKRMAYAWRDSCADYDNTPKTRTAIGYGIGASAMDTSRFLMKSFHNHIKRQDFVELISRDEYAWTNSIERYRHITKFLLTK